MPRTPNPKFMQPMTSFSRMTMEELQAFEDLEQNLTPREEHLLESNKRRFLFHLFQERKKEM